MQYLNNSVLSPDLDQDFMMETPLKKRADGHTEEKWMLQRSVVQKNE